MPNSGLVKGRNELVDELHVLFQATELPEKDDVVVTEEIHHVGYRAHVILTDIADTGLHLLGLNTGGVDGTPRRKEAEGINEEKECRKDQDNGYNVPT
jgi:hypothetical protein